MKILSKLNKLQSQSPDIVSLNKDEIAEINKIFIYIE